MKKIMMIAAAIGMTALAQAATLNWGSGTCFMVDIAGRRITGVLVQLMVWDGSAFSVQDSTLTSSALGFKGSFSGVWSGSDGYTVDKFPAGTPFYLRAYDTATPGWWNYMNLYANGINMSSPTYWTLNSGPDAGMAQTLSLSAQGYSFEFIPEPSSLALLALGVSALGLSTRPRRFRP